MNTTISKFLTVFFPDISLPNFLDMLEAKGTKVYLDGVQKDFSRTGDKMMFGFPSVMDDAEREKILGRT